MMMKVEHPVGMECCNYIPNQPDVQMYFVLTAPMHLPNLTFEIGSYDDDDDDEYLMSSSQPVGAPIRALIAHGIVLACI